MTIWLQAVKRRVLARRVTVSICECVHYGAFRYGREEPHPYETFARMLVRDRDRAGARAWFVDFLQHYRPKNLGEALGVKLSAVHGLWHYPWAKRLPADRGWFEDPLGFPDIVTQFCPEGILWFRIEQEFFWLERAVYSIRRFGYQPDPANPLSARQLVRADGTTAYLILDGNHRLSARAALGHPTVELSWLPHETVREEELADWPQVRKHVFTAADAAAIFGAYFTGNPNVRTTGTPAPLLECP